MSDRLDEIEHGFLGHPADDYYFVEATEFAWLIAEVKRLRKDLETMWEDNDYLRARDTKHTHDLDC